MGTPPPANLVAYPQLVRGAIPASQLPSNFINRYHDQPLGKGRRVVWEDIPEPKVDGFEQSINLLSA